MPEQGSGGQIRDQYEAIVESISEATYLLDSDRNLAYTNQSSLPHPDVSLGVIQGCDIMDLIERIVADDEDPERFEQALRTVYDESADVEFPSAVELDIDSPTGTTTREYRFSPCETGSKTGALVTSAESKEHSERKLKRYEQLFETLPVAVGINTLGEQGQFEFVNRAAADICDARSKAELKQYSPGDLYADPAEREQFSERLTESGMVKQYETEFTTLDGERIWVSITAELTEIDGEKRIIGVIEDISDRKQKERELREEQAFTEGVLDSLPDVFYAFDAEANLIKHNERLCSVTGYDSDELAAMAPREFFPEDERDRIIDAVSRVIQTGESVHSLDGHYLTKSGAEIPYEFSGSPFYDNDGSVAGFVGFGRDTSDRKERERELKRNREFLKQTQDVANIGGWEIDFRTDTLRWTDEVYHIHGQPLDFEPTVEKAAGFYHPADQETIRNAVQRATTEGESYDVEVRIVRPDSEVRWVRTLGEPWYEDGEIVGARGAFQDINDRKEREQELERHRNVIQAVDDGVYALDETGHFELVNDAMGDLTGYDTEDLLGEHTGYIKPDTAVERAESLVQPMILDDHTDDEATLELEIQRADGSEFPAEDHMTLLWDDNGERFEGTAGIIRNITKRKEREQELLTTNEQLEVLNRILRHDIQNGVQVIQGWAGKLQSELPAPYQDDLQRIIRTNENIKELTENSRELIQSLTQDEPETESVHLDGIVEGELERARSRYSDADFTVDGSLPGAVVSANGTLSSVVRNLLNNAVQHNRGQATITVRVEQEDDVVRLLVVDNGPGVPDDQKEKIFGKGERGLDSDGTGIGLYLVNQLVQGYGGDIRVEDSEHHNPPGVTGTDGSGGAAFVLELPTDTS